MLVSIGRFLGGAITVYGVQRILSVFFVGGAGVGGGDEQRCCVFRRLGKRLSHGTSVSFIAMNRCMHVYEPGKTDHRLYLWA